MKNNISYFFVLFIFFSCSKNIEKKDLSHSLIQKQTIKLEIDNSVNYYSWLNQVFEDESIEYLARRSKLTNEILIYNLDNKRLVKRIKFNKVGINSIPSLDGFYIHKLDSIFVSTSYLNTIYLCNNNGEILSKVSSPHSGAETIMVDSRKPFVKFGANIYTVTIPPFYENQKKVFKESTIDAKYDFTSSSHTNLNIKYPYKYINEGTYWSVGQLLYTRTFNNVEDMVYSFPICDSIQIVNLKNNNIKIKSMKSRFLPKIKDFSTPDNEGNYILEQSNGSYKTILFDKYNKVYYRFVVLPVEDVTKPKKKNDRISYFKRKFSIIISDEKFNILGETIVEKDKYNRLDFFIDKKGLWISDNIPNNPEFDESKLSFTLFKLEKKKK